jgi:hypothetical protein
MSAIFTLPLVAGDTGILSAKVDGGYIVLQRDENGKAQPAFVKELPKMEKK